jgi:large subunit ribosomal protein L19e
MSKRNAGSRKRGLGLGKTDWVSRIRATRRHLRRLRDSRQLSAEHYGTLVGMAKGGAFRSRSHVDEYVKARQLLRKR